VRQFSLVDAFSLNLSLSRAYIIRLWITGRQ
jgi:hypothetical protein